jgi:hypothetical protein
MGLCSSKIDGTLAFYGFNPLEDIKQIVHKELDKVNDKETLREFLNGPSFGMLDVMDNSVKKTIVVAKKYRKKVPLSKYVYFYVEFLNVVKRVERNQGLDGDEDEDLLKLRRNLENYLGDVNQLRDALE